VLNADLKLISEEALYDPIKVEGIPTQQFWVGDSRFEIWFSPIKRAIQLINLNMKFGDCESEGGASIFTPLEVAEKWTLPLFNYDR
jgi:hypothetical protein